MSDLAHIFERLGLSQYLDNFVEEGFDTWDTVLYITESDLDALNVKLGHRRKLQREIAHARGIPFDQLLAQPTVSSPVVPTHSVERGRSASTSQGDAPVAQPATHAKRKYRRHPKTDEHAPERPPSAYVIFSNEVREELKPHNLSFSDIAKTVGERWQALSPKDREPYESRATSIKDVFNREMVKYKKTPQYREYQQYLAEFRAKNPGSSGDGKRTRLEKDSRASSTSEQPARMLKQRTLMSTGAGSPVEGGPETSAVSLPRPPLLTARSTSSTSSASPTSNYGPGIPPPGGAVTSPAMGLPRPAPLQRIIPPDPRDPGVLGNPPPPPPPPPPLMAGSLDQHSRGPRNARRTGGGTAPSILRHDTSRSSLSSNLSVASSGSPAFSPITPIDEGPHRGFVRGPTLPPINQTPPPAPGLPFGSPSSCTVPPPASVSSAIPVQLADRRAVVHSTVPMKRLSIGDDAEAVRGIPRPRSNPPDRAMAGVGAATQPPPYDAEPDRAALDPLSVLALAGNMMDHRPPPTAPPSVAMTRPAERDDNRSRRDDMTK